MSDLEALAATLSASGDYRVLRRLLPTYVGGAPITSGDIRRAVIVDTETTGMDVQEDQVIELGMVVFEYEAESGQVGPVVARYGGLEDPGRPIPPESTKIHHITDAMVAGQRLDEQAIEHALRDVGLVIAHNAAFDRPFLEARLPLFTELHWGCSVRDVPWKAHGAASSSLEFLAYRAGFFYEAHRAETDCLATLAVLAQPLGDTGKPALHALLERARQASHQVAAIGSAYETKDILRARGYRWNAQARVWVGECSAADRDAEIAWLKESVYGGQGANIEIETLTAKLRYSRREGKREKLRI